MSDKLIHTIETQSSHGSTVREASRQAASTTFSSESVEESPRAERTSLRASPVNNLRFSLHRKPVVLNFLIFGHLELFRISDFRVSNLQRCLYLALFASLREIRSSASSVYAHRLLFISILLRQVGCRSRLANNAVAVKVRSQFATHGIFSQPSPQHSNGSYDYIEDYT